MDNVADSLVKNIEWYKTLMNHNQFENTNFDNRCGKFMNASNYLAENEVLNIRFDSELPEKVNHIALRYRVACDTSTIINVLNTLGELERMETLKRSSYMLKPGGRVFIAMEGENLADYLYMVRQVFPVAKIKYNMIVAWKDF